MMHYRYIGLDVRRASITEANRRSMSCGYTSMASAESGDAGGDTTLSSTNPAGCESAIVLE